MQSQRMQEQARKHLSKKVAFKVRPEENGNCKLIARQTPSCQEARMKELKKVIV